MAEPFIAQITLFAGNFAPRNWAFCDGQIMSIAQNTALFSLLGTTYGGNGQTTFGLPDLRSRVAIHAGSGPGLSSYALGQMGGTPTNTMISTNLPAHNHTLNASNLAGDQAGPGGNSLASEASGSTAVYAPGNTPTNALLNPMSIGLAGGNQPINNMQPYLGMYYIIALYGIFPSRS